MPIVREISHIGGYSADRERVFFHFRSDRLTQRVPAIILREIRSVNFVNRPSRESGVLRNPKRKKNEGRKKRERGDALSVPQIAVYVSRGVGYGSLLTDSRRRRGYRLTGFREIGRNVRLT